MADPYARFAEGIRAISGRPVAVTPDDDNDIPGGAPLYLVNASAVSGTITGVGLNGVEVALYVPAGQLVVFRLKRVKATGTDVSSILAGY